MTGGDTLILVLKRMLGLFRKIPPLSKILSLLDAIIQLRYLPISLIMIKDIQVGDDEIKIVNFANHTTIFLIDFTCLNRIQVIIKSYEDAPNSKIKFSKAKPYGLKHVKTEFVKIKIP